MENFAFYNPTKILFGKGQIAAIRQEIGPRERVLITYGGGSIFKNDVMPQVKQALSDHTVFEFGGIEANPDYDTLMKAVVIARQEKIDFILAVGGGSVLDGTKFIAAATHFAGDTWDILAKWAPVSQAVALGSVLTLPATGSESNPSSVVSRRSSGEKLFFASPHVQPRFAVLDPVTTYSLPTRQTVNGIVDAFVHVMEQYLTHPVGAMVQDRFAEGLLLTLVDQGPKVLKNPQDYQLRANIMWAATMALNGLIALGVPQDWTTHMIGHELTALHGLDHAQTLAVVLPGVMKVQREQKSEKIIQYAERVWGITQGSHQQKIDAAIAKTEQFFNTVGCKTRLSDYGVGKESIAKIVNQLQKHGMTQLGEHRDIDLKKVGLILEVCL